MQEMSGENEVYLLRGGVLLSPLSYRKTGPYGHMVSICTKVMSRGVHYIAFSVMPDVVLLWLELLVFSDC
jgi:hypothetical protein